MTCKYTSRYTFLMSNQLICCLRYIALKAPSRKRYQPKKRTKTLTPSRQSAAIFHHDNVKYVYVDIYLVYSSNANLTARATKWCLSASNADRKCLRERKWRKKWYKARHKSPASIRQIYIKNRVQIQSDQ